MFPTVFALCARHGLDPRRDPVPVAPAAHYHMGGIAVDGAGRTSLPGLWACGEVASTGVHGANRLASNSLLEGVVFGGRVAIDIAGALHAPAPAVPDGVRAELEANGPAARVDPALVSELRETMWRNVGLYRNEEGLRRAIAAIAAIAVRIPPGASEAANMALCGALIAAAARERRESRGGHFREDYPAADARWAHRSESALPRAVAEAR